MSRPAGHGSAIAAQLGAELRLTARRGENVLVTAVVPAAVLIFFASVPMLESRARSVDVLLPGALSLAVIASSLVSLGIATAYERQYGVLKRLGGSPLTRGDLVVAKIGAVLVVEVMQVALLAAISMGLLRWSPSAEFSPLAGLAALLAGTAAFAGFGLLLAGTLRAEATLAAANGLFVVFLLFGGVIVPADRLPAGLGAVAALLPASALTEVFRGAIEGGDVNRGLGILAAWAIVAILATVRTFRWE